MNKTAFMQPKRMEELKFEAPLAQFESEDFVDFCADFQSLVDLKVSNLNNNVSSSQQNSNNSNNSNRLGMLGSGGGGCNSSSGSSSSSNLSWAAAKGLEALMKKELDEDNNDVVIVEGGGGGADAVFTDTFSGSLEDLVNTFDEKITKCFNNLDETTDKLAPVQMRSQEELMNDCQMWWTITGNYGNILPIDWSKTYTRKLQIPALNLNEHVATKVSEDEFNSLSDEDEAVASDLDMHSLILGRSHEPEPEPPTADEVIKEIDFIMQETPESECCSEGGACSCQDRGESRGRTLCTAPFYREKLNDLSLNELNELLLELEAQIKDYSEVLIAELALRDELEFEKELKNSFISHLLAVQTKRRQHNLDRKKNNKVGGESKGASNTGPPSVPQSKYLTTVIPYHAHVGPPSNHNLTVLIKILKAIEQDSPAVPTLLTDYILKVLCPT